MLCVQKVCIEPYILISLSRRPCARHIYHIYPSLVLVQPRKNRPYITERLLMGRKKSNQTNKTSS